MCFRFASCLGVHVRDDDDLYGPTQPATRAVPVPPRYAADDTATTRTMSPALALHNGYHHCTNGSNHAQQQQGLDRGAGAHATAAYHHHHQTAHAGNETGGRTRSPAAAAMGGGHGYYAAGGARDEAVSKRPAAARNEDKVVAHGAGNNGEHCYPTATTAASAQHER
ncbi:unnamed protein product [Urochloa humidicola]